MELRNRVKEIVLKKFGLEIKPTPQLLQKLKTNKHRFKQIIDNKGKFDMTAPELKRFSEWLDVSMDEIIEDKKDDQRLIKDKTGLS